MAKHPDPAVTAVDGPRAVLGEGPVWDARRQCLWWLDIEDRQIFGLRPATGRTTAHRAPGRPGCVVLHQAGHLVVGVEARLFTFDPERASWALLAAIDSAAGAIRINDGACDRQGRLWFGTMDLGEAAPIGALYRLDRDGPRAMVTGLVASNGPAFSADGVWLYHCDTMGRRLLRYPLGADGALGPPQRLHQFTADHGLPDGMACDTQGGLWVALWGAGAVVRLDGDGRETDRVQLPVAQVTACAFAGPDLGALFVTTATLGLSEPYLATAADAGALFVCRPGWRGLLPTPLAPAPQPGSHSKD